METLKGVIEEMTKDGKRCKINDEWYSVFAAPSMGGAQIGDEIRFAYIIKESGGKMYNNIKGNVTVLSKSENNVPSAPSGNGGGTATTPNQNNMCIIRQNALTNAVSFYNARQTASKSVGEIEDGLATIVMIAETFAQFSSGEYGEKKRKLEEAEISEKEQALARVSRAVAPF